MTDLILFPQFLCKTRLSNLTHRAGEPKHSHCWLDITHVALSIVEVETLEQVESINRIVCVQDAMQILSLLDFD